MPETPKGPKLSAREAEANRKIEAGEYPRELAPVVMFLLDAAEKAGNRSETAFGETAEDIIRDGKRKMTSALDSAITEFTEEKYEKTLEILDEKIDELTALHRDMKHLGMPNNEPEKEQLDRLMRLRTILTSFIKKQG